MNEKPDRSASHPKSGNRRRRPQTRRDSNAPPKSPTAKPTSDHDEVALEPQAKQLTAAEPRQPSRSNTTRQSTPRPNSPRPNTPRSNTSQRSKPRESAAVSQAAAPPVEVVAPVANVTETPALEVVDPGVPVDAPAKFSQLGLSAGMLGTLARIEYLAPTPIQAGLIPRAMQGIDVIGQAKTGTGKTASFAIPILERIVKRHAGDGPQAIVLVPTRELAVQVRDEFVKLADQRKTQCVAIYGGKPIRSQIDKLQRGPQVVVGTPGRVLDHIQRRTLKLDQIRFVVLDEADRMLDIGFRPDIERILRHCPKERQTLLLSATVPPPIRRLAERYMNAPETVDFSPTEMTGETIEQRYFTVASDRKFDLLLHLLVREKPRQAIVFCRTKRGAQKIYERLAKRVRCADCIHGDLGQGARDRVMASFRAGELRFLVATDVVGRGIDISGVSHIINYDIPQFCDDYVHRVGRTGRMGREGIAFSFVSPEEGIELTRIEQRINRLLIRDEMRGFDTGEKLPSVTDPANPGVPVEEPPAPPSSASRRPVKRYRRAL